MSEEISDFKQKLLATIYYLVMQTKLHTYFLFRAKNIPNLIAFWEKAINLRAEHKDAGDDIATTAVSVGSAFHHIFDSSNQLSEIHWDFGALEAEPYFEDPKNEYEIEMNKKTDEYWQNLSDKVQEAKQGYPK